MGDNTLRELRANIERLHHLYHAFRRTGDPVYSKQARKLLKQMRRQFSDLASDMGISEGEFTRMFKAP